MHRIRTGTTLLLTVLGAVGCAANGAHDSVVDDRVPVRLKGPTMFAFYPTALDDAPDGIHDRGHLDESLSLAVDCLADAGVRVSSKVVGEDWIRIQDGRRSYPLYPPFEGVVGVFMVEPNRDARFVDAVSGTKALTSALPAAAAQYFNAPACGAQKSHRPRHGDSAKH